MFKVNHEKVQAILTAYKEGRAHALKKGERYRHPYSWDSKPSYARAVTKAWHTGYDSVKVIKNK